MSDKKLVSIARDFFEVAARKEDKDEAFLYKMAENVEMDFLMERMEVATDLFELNDKLGFVAQYNEEYIDLAIKAADMMAECHLKTLPFNEVADYLPATSKGSDISEGFTQRNAHSLAKLTK